MSILRHFVASTAVFCCVAAAPLAAHGSIQLKAQFTEQQDGSVASAASDVSTDLWSLQLLGSGSGIVIQSVKITLPASIQHPNIGIYFDLTAGDSIGYDAAGPYTPSPATGTSNPLASFQTSVINGVPKPTMLTLNFAGTGFGDAGDAFPFTLDVDNGNSIVRGYDIAGIYDSMRGTQIDVVYDNAFVSGLTASFNLDTPVGTVQDQIVFDNGNGNWYKGISGVVTLSDVPEPSALLVWTGLIGMIGCVARKCRAAA